MVLARRGTRAALLGRRQGIPTRGLVAVYPFTDGSGSTLTDSRGGLNGTLTGSPTWGTHSVTFAAASSQYIATGTTSQLSLSGDFSLAVVFGNGSSSNGTLVSLSSSSVNTEYHDLKASPTPTLIIESRTGSTTSTSTGIAYTTTARQIAILVRSGTSLTVYNMRDATSETLAGQSPTGAPRLGFGAIVRASPATFLSGALYYGAAYSVALNSSERNRFASAVGRSLSLAGVPLT